MREYKSDSFAFADLYQVLECIHGSAVQSRNTAHTKNQTLGKIFDDDMLNGICGTKEQWSGDLVNTDLSGGVHRYPVYRHRYIPSCLHEFLRSFV